MKQGKVDAMLGIFFGDEGKGKIIDVLAPKYDAVARFAGGPNAGHTIIFNGRKFVLRSIPSGIFSEEKINIIGNGCVVAPDLFMGEARELEAAGYELKNRLHISKRAHLILPTNRLLDKAYEAAKGKAKIGTTAKGIGPTYADKASRTGLRVGDILEPDFDERYARLKASHERTLKSLNYTDYDVTEEEKTWMEGVDFMRQFQLTDSEIEINRLLDEGKNIMAEGAQGTFLDICFGTYPYVSSSNTITGGVCTGLGVAPCRIGEVYGIFKAYSTRVGAGKFPSEDFGPDGEKLCELGHEFGAVTGRRRRTGWLDLVALRYAIMLNGVTHLCMMKSDVLDDFDTIKVCVAYTVNGKRIDHFPYNVENVEPVYEELPGWKCDITGLRSKKDFPEAFKNYIRFVEEGLKTPIKIISVGPDRMATIEM
jgi:adenylosuccinate synthase